MSRPAPIEINTPEVRRAISDALHDELEGVCSRVHITQAVARVFVVMDRASVGDIPKEHL